MDIMNAVIRYQCPFCGDVFITPNRHKCRYDPKFKNCYTCKYFVGWDAKENDMPLCGVDMGELSKQELQDNHYNIDCDSWEPF